MENEFYCKGFVPGPASPGPDWTQAEALAWSDPVLEGCFAASRGAFLRRDGQGFQLAYPLSCRAPFPLPPLFCFARAVCMASRGWWVFSFDQAGRPRS